MFCGKGPFGAVKPKYEDVKYTLDGDEIAEDYRVCMWENIPDDIQIYSSSLPSRIIGFSHRGDKVQCTCLKNYNYADIKEDLSENPIKVLEEVRKIHKKKKKDRFELLDME